VGDKTRGLYDKFKVTRTDGASEDGGKHHDCQYFVLDIDHDPHAIKALLAYADSCKAEYPLLASDVRAKAILACEHEWTETLHGPDTVGEHCLICDVDRDYDYGDEP
jgi:hypothetical protein